MENNPELNNEENDNIAKEAVKNAISTIDKPLSELIKNSKGTLIIFEDKEATEAKLKALVEQYKKEITDIIAIPELTPTQLARAKTIRAVYRDTRLEMQRVSKHNTTTLNDAKKDNQTEIEKLIEIVTPSEGVIDGKIKAEENRKAEEKRKLDEAETERKRKINQAITDAGIDFERITLIGKTQDDLDEFDSMYKEFEDNLDSLEEFAFDGNKLLERVLPKRADILERVEDAKKQAAKDLELQSKDEKLGEKESSLSQKEKELEERENNLKAMEAAAEKTKARIERITDLGLAFNGMVYVKDDFNVSTIELLTSDDEFEKIIENISNEMTRRAEAAAKAENNMKSYIALKDDYLEFTGEELALDVPIVTDELLLAVNNAIELGKTEKGKEEQRKKVEAIKEVGSIVMPVIENSFKELENNIAPNSIVNEDAKLILHNFFTDYAAKLQKLKVDLHQ